MNMLPTEPMDAARETSDHVQTCAHCGLPVPESRQGQNESFCCNGCETVFAILKQSGLDQSYYKLRSASLGRANSGPAYTSINEPLLDELDSEVFHESHSTIQDGGFYKTHLYLDGVHCAACVWLVERLPMEMAGVRNAHLNLPRARLSLEFDPKSVQLSEIARWLAKFGYGVQPRVDGEEAPETKEERRLLIRMGVCWALAGNIMLIAFALYSGLERDSGGLFVAARWVSFVLAVGSLGVGGSVFFKKAYHSLLVSIQSRTIRHLHMDTPISLGILVGFGASAWATVTGSGEVWFDSIAVLTAALLTARWLQLRARRIAGNSTEQLLGLLPSLARRAGLEGEAVKVRTDELKPGDIVIVKPGELIPVDGVIVAGSSLVNAAVLTGESVPVRKMVDDRVSAGTTNETDVLRISVQSAGEHSTIGRLLSWVADDTSNVPVILGWTNQLGGWFTLSVLTLALLTTVFWLFLDPSSAASHVVALLVITCPCALGMATPLALAVGTGKAARRGIFIKSESALDWLTRVDTVVLDKTGTVTEGSMSVASVHGTHSGISAQRVMMFAASLETESVHPIARAFQQWADHKTLPIATEMHHVPGQGVQGRVDGHDVRVGSLAWVDMSHPNTLHLAHSLLESGHSVVGIEVDGRTECLVTIADTLKVHARWMVDAIRKMGKEVVLCSGDNQVTTDRIGSEIGLSEHQCLGNHTPEMKRDLVEVLQSKGHIVAMIGDGVNDSAALRGAHVGIAVTDGSMASRFAADVYTTRSGLEVIVELFDESKKVMRVIHRNLFFSLIYNVLGAGLAIIGLVSPLLAAVAMPVSSLVVVVSSLAQRTFQPRSQSL